MLRSIKRFGTVALICAALFGAAGCNLTGPALTEDPNNPTTTSATATQLFVGVQAESFLMFSETEAFTICIWMQQCIGANGRFLEQQGVLYQFDPLSFSLQFSNLYIGGGLVDLRTIQTAEAGDPLFLGISQVWEALIIGEGADKWGDIPYAEAVGNIQYPNLEAQAQVYADLQNLLSTAITNLGAGGTGPGPADLVYGGNAANWIALAHSLKARLYLHTVEVNNVGNTAPPWNAPAVYDNVASEAALGISSNAGNWTTVHSGALLGESNGWYQFEVSSGFGGDLLEGPTLVGIMTARSDPRLPVYFNATNTATVRNTNNFSQPWLTYSENLLVQAEAALLKTGGSVAAADVFYAAYRTNEGLTAQALPATTLGALTEIMTEKYITLFQNYETWNDWKRNCIPALIPTSVPNPYGDGIPSRLYYGDAEQLANPNIPDASAQLATNGFRNPNDPNPCP